MKAPDPITATPERHGGDLTTARAKFGDPDGGWVDLSTGINPCSYPLPPLPLESWTRLPQADREAALIEAARDCYGAPRASIVAAPGTQILIQNLARLRSSSRVAVVSPTYTEHARSWRDAGHEVVELGAGELPPGLDVCVVVNPNNPDGRVLAHGTLTGLYQRLAKRGGWLVVDEAFADVQPKASIADWAGLPGLVVLRSFGKFFGMAGLRLGFALTDPEIAAGLSRRLGPWCTPGPALEIGRRALLDRKWIGDMRQKLIDRAEALDNVLIEGGLRVVGGTSLYRFVETPGDAETVHDRLGEKGILVRRFERLPRNLRFGLPASDAGLWRLKGALAARADVLNPE